MSCPARHAPSAGFATEQGRRAWLKAHGGVESKDTLSMVADPDPAAPLYPWQLYSLLGHQKLHAIVDAFYTRVYADAENPWFREAFARISGVEHHINTQVVLKLVRARTTIIPY
jgi:hypothetical protein